MENKRHETTGEVENLPTPEANEKRRVPRIYVASLSDYVDGRLHGQWLDATGDYDDLMDGVSTMLAASPMPGAEEWAIHDYENFEGLRLGEYEPLSLVSQLAQGIVEHGPAFAAWAEMNDHDADLLRRFDEAYRGDWSSLTEYTRELVDDLGIEDELDRVISPGLRPYVQVDHEALARDMELSGDIYVRQHEGGVYVFDATL